jgi:SAM-dependent methyltransferase
VGNERQTTAPDATLRFSSRVENYIKYRPGYPPEVIELLSAACGLNSQSVVADIGSGTGILAEIFLRNGNPVLGIEPNLEMRAAAERLLRHYPDFTSVDGTAENTSLPNSSVDFITAAQAFHWFDQSRARAEFVRILKPDGWVVLLWNERRLNSSGFLRALEDLLLRYGTDYGKVRHENVSGDIASFYEPNLFTAESFENLQAVDLDGLRGRIFSASYTPEPGHPQYEAMVEELHNLFYANEVRGKVTIEYDTKVYYGHLSRQ